MNIHQYNMHIPIPFQSIVYYISHLAADFFFQIYVNGILFTRMANKE